LNPKIKRLEEANLIREKCNCFELTEIGAIVAGSVEGFQKKLSVLDDYADFLAGHSLSDIPPEFLERISELEGGKVINASPLDVSVPYQEFVSNVLSSKTIRGLSSAFNPAYIELFKELADGGRDISIIVSSQVRELLASKFLKETKHFLECQGCTLYEFPDKIGVAITATDVSLTIGLFNHDGTYDTTSVLIIEKKPAIKWGLDLFEYYRSRSREVKL
jgi:predicted transcriptional regulator